MAVIIPAKTRTLRRNQETCVGRAVLTLDEKAMVMIGSMGVPEGVARQARIRISVGG
jgi:hypothetical protein